MSLRPSTCFPHARAVSLPQQRTTDLSNAHMRAITHIADAHTKRPINSRVTTNHRHIHTIVVITVTTDVHEIINAASVNTHIRLSVAHNRPVELAVGERHRLTLVADRLHHALHEHSVTIPTPRRIHRQTRTIPALSERGSFRPPTETSRLARNQLLSRRLSLTLRPKTRRISAKRTLPRPSATLTRLTLTIHMPLRNHNIRAATTPPDALYGP